MRYLAIDGSIIFSLLEETQALKSACFLMLKPTYSIGIAHPAQPVTRRTIT